MTRHKKLKSGMGGPKTLVEIGLSTLEWSLRGLDFPAGKEEILRKAEENNAPDDIFFALDQLEDRPFSDLEEIYRELR
jgi:hypothetical protein